MEIVPFIFIFIKNEKKKSLVTQSQTDKTSKKIFLNTKTITEHIFNYPMEIKEVYGCLGHPVYLKNY